MAITNDLLSTTLRAIRDEYVDQLYKKTAFLSAAKQFNGIEYEDGGTKVTQPLNIVEHSSITEYPTGYEPTNIAVRDALRGADYIWTDFSAPVVITHKEELENRGERAIVRILEARTQNVFGILRRETNKQILAGNSTVLLNLNTLNGVSSTTGFLENLDAGAQTNVVGGVSKLTYQNTRGWQNQRATASSAFGTNGLGAMNDIYIAANNVAPVGEINVIIASLALMNNYKKKLQAQERYIDEKTLDAGRMALAFAGAMVEQDSDMPTNAGVGTDEFSAYFLNFSGIKLVIHSDADYSTGDFVMGQGNQARVAHIYHKCQLTARHLGGQGVLVDADTF